MTTIASKRVTLHNRKIPLIFNYFYSARVFLIGIDSPSGIRSTLESYPEILLHETIHLFGDIYFDTFLYLLNLFMPTRSFVCYLIYSTIKFVKSLKGDFHPYELIHKGANERRRHWVYN